MKKLLTVSTLSILLATTPQNAYADGISQWLEDIFIRKDNMKLNTGMDVEGDEWHNVMDKYHGDNEADYTPHRNGFKESIEETYAPKDTNDEKSNKKNNDTKAPHPINDNNPNRI